MGFNQFRVKTQANTHPASVTPKSSGHKLPNASVAPKRVPKGDSHLALPERQRTASEASTSSFTTAAALLRRAKVFVDINSLPFNKCQAVVANREEKVRGLPQQRRLDSGRVHLEDAVPARQRNAKGGHGSGYRGAEHVYYVGNQRVSAFRPAGPIRRPPGHELQVKSVSRRKLILVLVTDTHTDNGTKKPTVRLACCRPVALDPAPSPVQKLCHSAGQISPHHPSHPHPQQSGPKSMRRRGGHGGCDGPTLTYDGPRPHDPRSLFPGK